MSIPPRPTALAAATTFVAAALQTATRVARADWHLSRQPMHVVDTVDQSFVEANSRRRYQRMGRHRVRLPMDSQTLVDFG